MKLLPKLSIIRSLLFTYGFDNFDDPERERFIVSKNVNDDRGLSELFDELTKPEFLFYKQEERGWYINTLEYFLKADESFDSIFYLFDTYFDDEVIDQRQFMRILLECLTRYHGEAIQNKSKN